MTVRTRFAPSPTGYLHVGGARTALFSWLYARRHGGSFVLRIVDTDLERSTAESVNAILEGMTWLGLEYDEGPFFQTHSFQRYDEVIGQLVEIVKDASGFSVVIKTGESFNGKQVISTMPIHKLKEMLVNTPYVPVAKPNRKLEFRSMIFMFLEINRPTVTDNHWIYFPDRDCLFQRTSEFKNFSPAMCPEGKASVCVEIPCDYKDLLWNMNDGVLYNEVIEQAVKEDYLEKEWVDSYHVIRERYAYPTYDLSYAEFNKNPRIY